MMFTDEALKTIGQYDIVEKLGDGTTATVYKAVQSSLDRFVALKLIHPNLANDPTFLPHLDHEARILARLDHVNIVHVYDVGEYRRRFYLAMQYVAGGTLQKRQAQLRARGERLALTEIEQIAQQIGSALEYAHSQGVIHRDVKPSNIIFAHDNRTLLGDFGISTIIGRPYGARALLPASGHAHGTLGSPAYLAPEQAHPELGPIGPASDVYSLAVVLYELVTGRVPFVANSPLAVISKHRNEQVPLPRTFNPDLPIEIERVLIRALAKDPLERYKRVAGFVDAFADAIKQALRTRPAIAGRRAARGRDEHPRDEPPALQHAAYQRRRHHADV
ncbi:MAG: serine/threonine protein kinase [Roseiflexaceae bacterium]|nr:serine/threonine protein kinase [Roseiflexaceae bacterium]